jgi:uncharacterized repeat protein (TIGR01451 family)
MTLAFQYAAAATPGSALAAVEGCDSFAIYTTDVNGDTVNQNHYASKPEVYLNGGPSKGVGLVAGTKLYYQVQEPDGTPLMEIRSVVLASDGTFKVQLYPFDTTTNNGDEYKVVVSTEADLSEGGCTKSDNFKVDGPGSLKITKTVEGGPSNVSGDFDIHVNCGEAGSFNRTISFPDPGFVTITGIDAKAHCTVTETDTPNPPAGYSWGDATFSGNPATIDSGKTVTVHVVNHLNLIPAPALTVEKSVSTSASGPWSDQVNVQTGTTVFFKITVTNTGNTDLTAVTLSDNTFDLVAKGCTIPTTLAVGAHFDCAYSSVAATGTTTNTATADSEETGPDTDTATVVATVTPPPAGLTIDKTNNAPLVNVGGSQLPTAAEGSTVTFTLTYTHTGSASTDGTITDVLPAGLTYVTGSATGSADFTFSGYNAGTRTLTWTASDGVSASGSVTYQAKVDAGAAGLAQPLENVATIDSSDTQPDSDVSDVFVAVPPLAETDNPNVPTAPQTDIASSGGTQAPGLNMGLVLLFLSVVTFVVAFMTPVPAALRGKDRNR